MQEASLETTGTHTILITFPPSQKYNDCSSLTWQAHKLHERESHRPLVIKKDFPPPSRGKSIIQGKETPFIFDAL